MIELVARTAADAFMEVTVFVASMIGLFGYLQLRFGDRLNRFLATRWRIGPLLGALVGVIPGCGGAILVTPLYAHQRVSFGTVIAALVATMGDSSFVIIAADPGLALTLHAVLFVAGVVCGFTVDAIGLKPRLRTPALLAAPQAAPAVVGASAPNGWTGPPAGGGRPATGGVPGVPPPTPFAARRKGARSSSELWPLLFWLLVGVGAMLTVPELLQGVGPDDADADGGIDLALVIGLAGTLAAAALAHSERRARRRGHPRRQVSDVVEVLRTSATESARIGMWVTVAFFGMEMVALFGVSVIAMVSIAGIGGVLVGSALGLVPGCAPQIVLTGLYASGSLPFPTLLANALSQDGDALLPMLLMERRSALIASIITTIPGIVAGSLLLFTGIGS